MVNLLEQRGIENVILLGVHTNMCVLGRPFGIRQMVYQGKNVVLVRDLTDAMYNPASEAADQSLWRHRSRHRPYRAALVPDDHEHRLPRRSAATVQRRHAAAVGLSGQRRRVSAAQTLADFAARLERDYDTACTVLDGRKQFGIEGIEAIERADAVVLYVRRRPMPKAQMDVLRRYLDAGKPLVALRTSSHAFAVRKGTLPEGVEQWPTFDRDVLGGEYKNHLGNAQGTDIAPVGGNSAADRRCWPASNRSPGTARARSIAARTSIRRPRYFSRARRAINRSPSLGRGSTKRPASSTPRSATPTTSPSRSSANCCVNAIYWAMDRKVPATSR